MPGLGPCRLDFLRIPARTAKLQLARAKARVAGVVDLKEKQCESNLTRLLITRNIFQTLSESFLGGGV